MLEAIAGGTALGRGAVWILVGALGCLAAGTVMRGLAVLRWPGGRTRARWWSLVSWWAVFLSLAVALAAGRPALLVLFAVVSLLALREALALTAPAGAYLPTAVLGVGLYAWAWATPDVLFTRVLPACLALLGVAEILWRLRLRPRMDDARATLVALLVAVVGPSFVAAVASLPPPATRPDEAVGWVVLLLLLTELNDMAQAWWGRAFGTRRMAPRLSPNKTWEGLAGGLVTTPAAALLLGPLVTDYGRVSPPGGVDGAPAWVWPALLGLAVFLAGVVGDLNESWLKRRAGVKDSGHLLPGQGGLLDRIDSLSVTAPVYYALTCLLWSPVR